MNLTQVSSDQTSTTHTTELHSTLSSHIHCAVTNWIQSVHSSIPIIAIQLLHYCTCSTDTQTHQCVLDTPTSMVDRTPVDCYQFTMMVSTVSSYHRHQMTGRTRWPAPCPLDTTCVQNTHDSITSHWQPAFKPRCATAADNAFLRHCCR